MVFRCDLKLAACNVIAMWMRIGLRIEDLAINLVEVSYATHLTYAAKNSNVLSYILQRF